jgi:hypothetical protein
MNIKQRMSKIMDTNQRDTLYLLLWALADKERLTIIGLMSDGQEHQIRPMAERMKILPLEASEHMKVLHHAGLLRLRMEGPRYFYHLNENRVAELKSYIGMIDTLPTVAEKVASDNDWIEALDYDEDDKKVLREYTYNGRLLDISMKEKKWLVVLRWLVTKFEPDVRYTEKQVNEIIKQVHGDYATIRRDLIDFAFMQRERGGASYWRTSNEKAS